MKFEIPKMVKIEGGTFQMGSNYLERELPVHEVGVSSFYMAPFQVSNVQFAIFLNETGISEIVLENGKKYTFVNPFEWGLKQIGGKWQSTQGFEQHPIIFVSWYGALEYCKWISQKTGLSYRLPTEAEWEYTARGGKQGKGFPYAGGHRLEEVGWSGSNSYGETKPIGLKIPNELGLYDMSGNVWEWCADYWHENYKNAPNDGSIWLTDGYTASRVVRGGSCRISYSDDWRVSSRMSVNANGKFANLGFRITRY